MNMTKVTDALAKHGDQPSPDRAGRHANTLACGRQQSSSSGIRRQTQFYAVYREIPADDMEG